MNVDAYACLVFTATWNAADSPAALGWTPGPLPIPLPTTIVTRARGGAALLTDRAARVTYFAQRVHNLLFGPPSTADGPPRRWHIAAKAEAADVNNARVQAWELLFDGAGSYLAIAHIQLGTPAAPSLSELTVVRGPGREWLKASLDSPLELADSRPFLLSHLVWEGDSLPEPYESREVVDSLRGWNLVERWQWFLATGQGPDAGLPDTEDPSLFDGKVWLSSDWRALVLRDGIAYVGLTPRSPAEASGQSFHDLARVYIRSIYLDVLLLGILQLYAVRGYAEAIAAVRVEHEPIGLAKSIEQLEVGLLRLRTGLWGRDVTHRSGVASAILDAFQRQHQLADLYTQIVADLTDMSRYVLARRASLEEAERQAREDNKEKEERAHRLAEDRQRQTERAIALISFVLLPVSIIFSVTSSWAAPNPTLFWVSVGVSVGIVTLMLCMSSTLRRALFRRAERRADLPPGGRGMVG
jgi:hypothetical protein